MSDYRKFLGDSPDAAYHTAEISSDFVYEITGNIADTEYLSFALYGTSINGWNRGAANISNQSMDFDDKGNFTIVLSKTKPADRDVDWLHLEDDIHMVMVRQYDHSRAGKQGASFTIRNLAPPAFAPATDSEIATWLNNAADFFNSTVDGAIALGEMLSTGANSIDPPRSYNADFGGIFYPTQDNEYYGSWFYLENDEALIVEGAVPNAPYWSISLQNRWMQSLDYEHYQVSLNDEDIHTEDGRYRVISEKPSLKVVEFDSL